MSRLSPRIKPTQPTFSAVWAISVAILYGLISEGLFQLTNEALIGTFSISFLLLMPFALGILTVALVAPRLQRSWFYAAFAPWIPCVVVGILAALVLLEAWACVLMALPIFLIISSVGGVMTKVVIDSRRKNDGLGAWIIFVALVPYLFGPIEQQWEAQSVPREVAQVIEIDASPEVVWSSFIAVPAIQPEERPFAWFPLLGLPEPVAAVLHDSGPAGIRYARYDNGLQVVEPTLIWEPLETYRFGVELDPASLVDSPLTNALESGVFSVEYVEYRLEQGEDAETVTLTLTSRYRLQTPINFYAALWTDFLLADFESTILQVVKQRAEASWETR